MSDRPLLWYLNRLRSMTPAEVVHRLVERYRRVVSGIERPGWEKYTGIGDTPMLPGLQRAVDERQGQILEVTERLARCVLEGKFAALGVIWPDCSLYDKSALAERWRLDPVTGQRWPGKDAYCFDIDLKRQSGLGDIKYVWELNRLQFLQPLAVHWRISRQRATLEAIETVIESWYGANPPFQGVAWASGIELALRAISLLTVSSLCREDLSAATKARVNAILSASLYWIRRFPSLHSSANNHLVAELAGLYLITAGAPYLTDAAAIGQHAQTALESEALRQFHPDGIPAEQSLTYGAFTAELLLLCAFVGDACGRPFGQTTLQRLMHFSSAVAVMSAGDGWVPAIGDDDEGRVISGCEPEPHYVCSVSNSIAVFLGQPAPCSPPRSRAHTLRDAVFGTAPSASATSVAGLRTFAQGGYSVVRETRAGRRVLLTFDHGPLGYLSLAAHGHADALSLTLALDDAPVLVDPGTYLYHSGLEWRSWFRGTAAHNTLSIGGENQSVITGPFNWGRKAQARLQVSEDSRNWRVVASHDGFVRRFGVKHERELVAQVDGLTVVDRLVGSDAGAAAEIVFQFAPAVGVRENDHRLDLDLDGSHVATLQFEPGGTLQLVRGEPGVSGGWVSPSFGVLTPAWRVVWRGPIGVVGVSTRIIWGPANCTR